jgi:hypothetical protein
MARCSAVASPSTDEVVIVNLVNGTITRRINIGGAPSRLATFGIQRPGQYMLRQ